MRTWAVKCRHEQNCSIKNDYSNANLRAGPDLSYPAESLAFAAIDDEPSGIIRLNISNVSYVCSHCRKLLVLTAAADVVLHEGGSYDVCRSLRQIQKSAEFLVDFRSIVKALPFMEHRGEDLELTAHGCVVLGAIYELVDLYRDIAKSELNGVPR